MSPDTITDTITREASDVISLSLSLARETPRNGSNFTRHNYSPRNQDAFPVRLT